MVPSVGFITALYAVFEPSIKACAKVFGLICFSSFSALANPLKICDNITPELPLAPIREPLAANSAIVYTLSSLALFISLTAEFIVNAILVPVSPSGTGNTFNELT